jgi:hypothetical protein
LQPQSIFCTQQCASLPNPREKDVSKWSTFIDYLSAYAVKPGDDNAAS